MRDVGGKRGKDWDKLVFYQVGERIVLDRLAMDMAVSSGNALLGGGEALRVRACGGP